jgi:hypothetical protein
VSVGITGEDAGATGFTGYYVDGYTVVLRWDTTGGFSYVS